MPPSAPDDALLYPIANTPEPGGVVEVESGLLWIRLSLPYRLDHVNVWAIAAKAGWTIVDTGLGTAQTIDAWERLLDGPLAGRPVERVLATHFHPDHIGLAGWLTERTGASFAASLSEWLFARALGTDATAAQRSVHERFYRSAGLDETLLTAVLGRGNAYARSVRALPPALIRLRHGDRVRLGDADWRVIVGGGHTPEHVCLFRAADAGRRALLLSGDQVLPRISPNVSVWPTEPDADPLTDFLESFSTLRALPEDVLVLPSHGQPFVGLHRRLDAVQRHHGERLDEIRALCTEPRSAAQVAAALFRADLDAHQTIFAVGEAIAHLNHMIGQGTLSRSAGPGGIDLYRLVS